MKQRGVIIFLFALIFILPFIQAQTYSKFDSFTDNVKLFFSSGENKVKLALEIREKEVNSAIENTNEGKTQEAIKNLEKSQTKLQLIQEKISLENSEEVKQSVEKIKEKINEESLSEEFSDYILEEEKTQLTAELTQKTFEYCKSLAQENYALMLKQEKCNPETAQEGLQKELQELKKIQEKSFTELMLDIRSCIDDPGTCNCEDNIEISQKAKCEKMVALAIKCEYKDEKDSCEELKSMKPVEGDGFAESFVPEFLRNLFKEKEYMIDYNIEKSDVPPECYNENEKVKTQCAVFRDKKEIHSKCWDEEGNFLVDECGRPDETTPTMEESIPQCYDEENNFLEEKCGKITIIWNEEGLINYIIGTEVEKIAEEFEIASEEHKIEIEGKEGQEIKNEIDFIEGEIAQRTFAPGTFETGDSEEDVKNIVIEQGGENSGDDGLTPEINTEVNGENNGNDGLTPEIETEVNGEGQGDDGFEPEIETDGHEE